MVKRRGLCFGSSSNTPSTFVTLSTTSALISVHLSDAAVSVVKNGFPVPAAKMTTFPFSCVLKETIQFKSLLLPTTIRVFNTICNPFSALSNHS